MYQISTALGALVLDYLSLVWTDDDKQQCYTEIEICFSLFKVATDQEMN